MSEFGRNNVKKYAVLSGLENVNPGLVLTSPTIILWVLIAISAIGLNAL